MAIYLTVYEIIIIIIIIIVIYLLMEVVPVYLTRLTVCLSTGRSKTDFTA